MVSRKTPLRYNISSWNQLTKCLSNNSNDLHIRVSEFVNDHRLEGKVIKVEHDLFGVLFACIVDGKGNLLSYDIDSGLQGLSTDDILRELRKFGYLITFDKRIHLDGDQLQYLMTIRDLEFDKIRILEVYEYDKKLDRYKYTPNIVAFQVDKLPEWLSNSRAASIDEFSSALVSGSAINLSEVSKSRKFDWSWLDYVANIADILRDNS